MKVVITARAAAEMQAFASNHPDTEIGAITALRLVPEEDEVHVCYLIPVPMTVTPTRVDYDTDALPDHIMDALTGDPEITLTGCWHKHPGSAKPSYSARDRDEDYAKQVTAAPFHIALISNSAGLNPIAYVVLPSQSPSSVVFGETHETPKTPPHPRVIEVACEINWNTCYGEINVIDFLDRANPLISRPKPVKPVRPVSPAFRGLGSGTLLPSHSITSGNSKPANNQYGKAKKKKEKKEDGTKQNPCTFPLVDDTIFWNDEEDTDQWPWSSDAQGMVASEGSLYEEFLRSKGLTRAQADARGLPYDDAHIREYLGFLDIKGASL